MEHQILLEKVGETKTDKLIQDCYKIYRESFDKHFPEYFKGNDSKMISIVTTTKQNEIKGIGMSCINDLLNDNWGKFLSAMMGGGTASLTPTSGAPRGIRCHGGTGFSFWGNPALNTVGTTIATGNGSTVLTRTQVSFANSVQNLVSQVGGWSSGLGQVSFTGLIQANQDYTITQTSVTALWADTSQNSTFYLLEASDISPNIPVLLGETINVNYFMVFS